MAWYKTKFNNTYSYSISSSSCKTVFHKCSDITLDELNDPDRDYDSFHSTYFIKEYVKITNEGEKVHLPSGIYNGNRVDEGSKCKLIPMSLNRDLQLLNLESNNVLSSDFVTFINSKDIYKTLPNKIYKKGVLLYGPPGTGKTISIQKILLDHAPKDSIAVFVTDVPCIELLTNFAEDPRLKIIVFEEICGIINNEELADLLTFLDGETSLSNCYIIASTNYPDKLPDNLTNRPGRFDVLCEVGALSENDRKLFLNYYYREPTIEEIKLTKNMTIVQLTEVILLIKRDKLSFEKAVKKLRDHEELSKTRFAKKKQDEDLYKDIL